jgi:hypothetical protein
MYYAYLYRDVDNTPIYVGKGKHNRAFQHIKSDTYLGRLLRKRLLDGYELIPEIYKCESEELAFFVEEELVIKFGRKDLNEGTLLNLTNGGEGQSGRSPWNKDRKCTEEENTAKSNRMIGKPSNRKGIPNKIAPTVESNIARSLKLKGVPQKKRTPEQIKNMVDGKRKARLSIIINKQ